MSSDGSDRSRVRRFYDSAARVRENNSISNRRNTRIFHLRNFNNWTKSVFINDYIRKICKDSIVVLDLCCGKGGDQLKWLKARVRHVTFVDISSDSIDVCRQRYRQLQNKYGVFSADFHVFDCTDSRLHVTLSQYRKYDLVSCQFALHYAFESYNQVCAVLQNVSESLNDGGYFIASIPNAYELVRRAKKSLSKYVEKLRGLDEPSSAPEDSKIEDISFGNSVYSIRFPRSSFHVTGSDPKSLKFPLFGAKYDFRLDGVVDCPEFLVYPPLLIRLAKQYKLHIITLPVTFGENFYKSVRYHESLELLMRMEALECWKNDTDHSPPDDVEYNHVVERLCEPDLRYSQPLGTLTKSEWEVATMYSLIAFRKNHT